MQPPPAPRRLIDLAGVADLEFKALMKPRYAEPESRAEFPQIDAVSTALFGLAADEAEAVETPAGWRPIDRMPVRDQVEAFEAAGWDVTDDRRRPLRMLPQFAQQLWLAIHGVAGTLPFQPEASDDRLESSLAREAATFRRDRR